MAGVVAQRIERNFLPSQDLVTWTEGKIQKVPLGFGGKVQYYAVNLFKLLANLFCLPFAIVYSLSKSMASRVVAVFSSAAPKPVLGPMNGNVLPAHVGFADSQFQTEGVGISASATPLAGRSDWERWLNPKRIEGTADGDYRRFFINVLRNPEPFINILRETNATAHRFSLEWSVIEPQKGQYDQEAIGLYRNFIQRLRQNGIEPYVTTHHFVCPEWFAQEGGFSKLENVDTYKNHTLRMMQTFPEVINWMPFNEINVDGFQKYVRGVYPPGEEGNIAAAGVAMRNMLLAHCQIYKEAKALRPELQIGSTHQWLNFEPLEGNPLERVICYFLSKITHYACYNFFKTGQFSLEIPGKANVQLSIPQNEWERHKGFSDFIGVQFYGYPRLKAGFNGGQEYPGYKTMNFNFWKFGLTFGASCREGEAMQSFGPGFYPESLDACLTEAAALNKPIVISETGADAMVQKWGEKGFKQDNEAQKAYFERILPILDKFKGQLKAFFAWTLVRKHLEWDRGDGPCLGVVDVVRDANRNIIGHQLSPAAVLLQGLYARVRNQQQQAAA